MSSEKIRFLLNYKWIERYNNGQAVTNQTRSEEFLTKDALETRISELKLRAPPSAGMKLEFTKYKVTTEKLK